MHVVIPVVERLVDAAGVPSPGQPGPMEDVRNVEGRRSPTAVRGRRAVIAPGAYDGLTARLVELAGFPVVYATGAGISNSQLALADVGLVTMTEMLEQVRKMTAAVHVPVICDIDTGYGNAVNLLPHGAGVHPRRRRGRANRGSGHPQEVRPLRRQAVDPVRRGGPEDPRRGRRARRRRPGDHRADRRHRGGRLRRGAAPRARLSRGRRRRALRRSAAHASRNWPRLAAPFRA